VRMPWHDVAGDDGFEWSLNVTRMVCAILLLLPAFFLGCVAAILALEDTRHDQPVLSVILGVAAAGIVLVAPHLRERMAQIGIAVHARGGEPWRAKLPVYSTFATATIASFLVAQAPALFGFIVAALTRSLLPLWIGMSVTYLAWAMLWPRRITWARWTWQAGVDRQTEEAPS